MPDYTTEREAFVAFSQHPSATDDDRRSQFDMICGLPDITNVHVESSWEHSALVLKTQHISLQIPKTEPRGTRPYAPTYIPLRLGRFAICISRFALHNQGDRRTMCAELQCFNLTRTFTRREDAPFHHPHVNSNGNVCINTTGSHEVRQNIARGELLPVVELCLDMLHSFDQSPYGGRGFWRQAASAQLEETRS